MRIFITSTPDELKSYQEAAKGIVSDLGHEPMLRNPTARRGLDPVTACRRQVGLADAMLAIIGWRRGRVPAATLGGDNLRPWSYWEVQSAFEHGLPVIALLAGEAFAPELREDVSEARAAVDDFRGELARLAAVFDDEPDFHRLIRAKLREAERASRSSDTTSAGIELRRFPPPELPAQPYPLLLPYTHPGLIAGRDGDLADLRRTLSRPLTIVGLHAASGTGKSSLLAGGLVPALRAEGRPVAFVRHPAEAGLAASLLADLVVTEALGTDAGATDARGFVNRLVAVRRLAGDVPPLLVIDQFEDLLKDGVEASRAVLGTLLAASAQRLPGLDGPPCRWLLAYRQEYHGKFTVWLEDVLREARGLDLEGIDTLPHDLSEPSRFVAWPLRPLATPHPDADDPAAAATRVFLDAIEKPLSQKIYPWTFAPGQAERLARAFADARRRRPDAPLAPEFQVVLGHLLELAGEPTGDEPVTVEVPDEPAELIDRALEDHLRRALDLAFPMGLDKTARAARTRALLVLRELAEVHGRREPGRSPDALAQALGKEGREYLEKLSTPRTRLVVRERQATAESSDPWVYVLAHDRLAEVLVRVVDEGHWARLGIDAGLLALRRFVALESQLYAAGDVEQATAVRPRIFATIDSNQEVLLWDDPPRAWWEACRARRRRDRWRQTTRRAVAAVAVAVVALAAWTSADRRARRRALLEEVAAGEPAAAFRALGELTQDPGYDAHKLVERLRARQSPFDVFERGLGGIDETRRAEILLRTAELALPILDRTPDDPVLIASLVWALDLFAARDPVFEDRALALRNRVLEPLRRGRPPPPLPPNGDPRWVEIPAGTFRLGTGRDESHERRVTLSRFRIMAHEVTNAEYRRLFPDHPGAGDLPAGWVTWYQAYTYAAWLGGRLPTVWEWELAARGGCEHAFCRRDGSEAALDEVAWWVGNAVDPETGEPSLKAVMRLEPNPWGLWDVYGNVWEWNADWHGDPAETLAADPPGPTATAHDDRTLRGGSAWKSSEWQSPSKRWKYPPNLGSADLGLRVVIARPESRRSW